ncbi:MAG: sigma-54-dependent Fis family transcriptional regulator [Myxococcales bacterium]|nr:sigma-54-dependent Fis family transcriptional regulator [Myxococcales bacterium]
MTGRILVVDDDADMCRELARALGKRGFDVTTRESADEAYALVLDGDFDAVVTDLNLRGMSGVELCDRVVSNRPAIPVVVVTGFGSMETAVATLRAGAFDFITKPFNAEQLALTLERAIRHRRLEDEVRALRTRRAAADGFGSFVGSSPAMLQVFDLIDRVSPTDATVLVTGESGSGKELVARAIHERSRRSAGPLVAVNCAALPEALLESELFGHVKGAFTDARSARKGLFAEASGGTLLLDEIGELPLGMQAKLLRALEGRTVRPVGSDAEVPFDARLVASTNQDLASLVAEKRFREDLFHRIDVVHLELPPLRARGRDVLDLAQTFVARFAERHKKTVAGLSSEAAAKLLDYSWPGNVRELQNAMERAVALARFEQVAVDDLPPRIRSYQSTDVLVTSGDPRELVTLEEVERRYIERVMDAVSWNKTEATRILGIDRSTLYRKLERYKLAPRE